MATPSKMVSSTGEGRRSSDGWLNAMIVVITIMTSLSQTYLSLVNSITESTNLPDPSDGADLPIPLTGESTARKPLMAECCKFSSGAVYIDI